MRPIFKTTAFMAAGLATISLTACGAKTPEQLILGEWVQAAPVSMTEQGMTVTLSETSTHYKADGSVKGSATIKLGGLPDNMSTYVMAGNGTWSLVDGKLVETMNSANVMAAGDNANAKAVAEQMQDQFQGQTATTSEIIKLTKSELIVRDLESDITMNYKRK
jgi:predicted small lipoprotein YifL